MADHDVTMGEVVRRLDSIAGQLAQITATLANYQRDAAETYVRKDVQKTKDDALTARVDDLEEDRDKQQDRNRQLGIAIISGAVLIILSIALQVIGLPAGQG